MASFQATIGWKSMRKRENKYYRSKNYKIPLWLLLKPKQGGKE